MISRLHVLALVGLSLAISGAALTLLGEPVSIAWLGVIGTASGGAYLACEVFNHIGWRIHILQGWFVHRPHFGGDWIVEVSPMFEKEGKRVESFRASAKIKQTYTGIHLAFQSPESEGELLCGGIVKHADGTYRLSGTYLNTPNLERQRNGSNAHRGSFWLTVVGRANKPSELRGAYWTERETSGEMVFRRR